MFLTNGFSAKLIKYNRTPNEYNLNIPYDDEDKQEVNIKVIPYNIDNGINFGTYTTPEATGYFMLRREVDVKEGDEILFENKTYSILKVADKWIYNRIEYKVAICK